MVVIGFDYGERRIGVAVGQTISHTATALRVFDAVQQRPDWQAISAVIDEWQPDLLILGCPADTSATQGSPAHPLRQRIQRFARQLDGRYHLPVQFIDESYSSQEAESRRQRSDPGLDAIAAQIIVETWLREQETP